MHRRILDAAKQLFVKEGFDNVSIRRIASAIEYSPAAIYRYFGNKGEILTALREEGFAQFVIEQQARAAEGMDPLERLKLGGRNYIRFALQEPDYFELMFCTDCNDVDLESPAVRNSMASFHLFRDAVKDAVATGHFGDTDLETVVFTLWSCVQGLAHLAMTGRVSLMTGGADLDALIDSILEFNLRPLMRGEEGERR